MAADRPKRLEDHLRLGGESIPYQVKFSPRKTLKVTVYPDASVYVEAPESRSLDEVRAKLERRTRWIARQRDYFGRFKPRPPDKAFKSGESFVYLGRQYRLKVKEGKKSRAALNGRFLQVIVAGRSSDVRTVRNAVVAWYTERAKEVFRRRLERCHAQVKRLGVSLPKMIVRTMKRRWGSYTKAGTIVLNRELVQAPIHCVDYVIFHELVHSIVPNHGHHFYRLLSRYVPDWEMRKARLEATMAQLPGGVTACRL